MKGIWKQLLQASVRLEATKFIVVVPFGYGSKFFLKNYSLCFFCIDWRKDGTHQRTGNLHCNPIFILLSMSEPWRMGS